ncbi:PASTA domain-containing protein [Coriobacteriia bacterium Es71-Z0120]|uniref:PASTA domain-containing protein n=1 Tax=Parvivirga hydrogeniphila TaxID=2939460 RepID=UPI002260FB48|nr:PASTA domain-containing protein [Parvivirga hydrogeniphila]MCL4079542.1 PASTA domain-containing protein [Parvivirga hydrogeniphila]
MLVCVTVLAIVGVSVAARASRVLVPAVVGLPQPDAINRLQKAGLVVEDGGTLFSNDVPRNHVISQEPAAGSTVERGTSVRIVLSAGAETFAMPDVIGRSADEASRELSELGLTVSTQVVESQLASGTVLESFPAPGAEVRAGTPVRLSIAGQPVSPSEIAQYSFVGATVFLDPVPRGTTPDVTYEVARRIRALIEASGGTVVVSRSPSATSTALADRVAAARAATATVAVVLDVASSGQSGLALSLDPSKTGPSATVSSSIASATAQALSAAGLASRDAGRFRDPILSVVSCPGIRVLLGSLADPADVARFGDPDWADTVARAVYRGLGVGLGRGPR